MPTTTRMAYPQSSTAVLLFDEDGDSILLTERIAKHQGGKFGCPGGKADFGETLAESAERELFEETGIRAKCVPTGYVANCVYKGEGRHFLCVWFAGRIKGKRPKVDFVEKDASGEAKCKGWGWYGYDEMVGMPMMPSTLSAFIHHCRGEGKMVLKEFSDDPTMLKMFPGQAAKLEDRSVVRTTIEYADGAIKSAEGPDAQKIWEHIQGAETMSYIHGCRYEGPCMRVKRNECEKEAD